MVKTVHWEQEKRKVSGGSALKIEEYISNQNKTKNSINDNQWQTLAMIVNRWSMVIYLLTNIVTFFVFGIKVKDHI